VESTPVLSGDDLEHTLYVDGFGAAGVDDTALPNGLENRIEPLFAMKREKHVSVEIHKDERYRGIPVTDPSSTCFQLMRGHEGAAKSVHATQVFGEIPVFRDILKGFFLGNHHDEPGIFPLPADMFGSQHIDESPNGIEERVIEVQIYAHRSDLIKPFPDSLSDDLRDSLIIPSTRASKIPFRMIPQKIFHYCFLHFTVGQTLTLERRKSESIKSKLNSKHEIRNKFKIRMFEWQKRRKLLEIESLKSAVRNREQTKSGRSEKLQLFSNLSFFRFFRPPICLCPQPSLDQKKR
jgi:hypothetical protein